MKEKERKKCFFYDNGWHSTRHATKCGADDIDRRVGKSNGWRNTSESSAGEEEGDDDDDDDDDDVLQLYSSHGRHALSPSRGRPVNRTGCPIISVCNVV
jgi:hypothetical protein